MGDGVHYGRSGGAVSWVGWVVVACVALAGSAGLVWLVRKPRPVLLPPPPEQLPPQLPEPTPEPEPEPELVVEEHPLVPVLRPPDPAVARRWVAMLTAAAPLVALPLYAHHRRFVRYHEFKGLPQQTAFGTWLRAETLGAGTLGWWYVTGFLKDGLRVPENAVSRPVLCIHGYSQNATNFVGLRRVLEADGRPTIAVSLWHRFAPLEWYARRLGQRIATLAAEYPDGIDVVAHSMGGVVLRMVLHAQPDLQQVVRTVVTLGSPHRGTAAARGIPLLPELVALRRRSTLLRDLPQLPDLVPNGRVVTIAGDTDTIVYPVETSLVPGAEAVVLHGIGHAGLLTSPESWEAVRSALAR